MLKVTKLEQERDHVSRVRAAAMEGLSQPELIHRRAQNGIKTCTTVALLKVDHTKSTSIRVRRDR